MTFRGPARFLRTGPLPSDRFGTAGGVLCENEKFPLTFDPEVTIMSKATYFGPIVSGDGAGYSGGREINV